MEVDDTICRLCMKVCKLEQSVPLQEIAEMVMYCVSIQIEENDGLPLTACLTCKADALIAYNFKVRCEETNKQLRSQDFKLQLSTQCCKVESGTENHDDVAENINESNALNENFKSEPATETSNENLGDYFACRFCSRIFCYKKSLRLHEKRHENGLKCCTCNKEFSTVRQLSNHAHLHSRKGAHLCQTCGKQFSLPENLIRHERIHLGLRPYSCEICKKAFTQSGDLKSHMVTHTAEKNYLCSFCGNKFTRELTLKVHVRRVHLNTGRCHSCSLCNKSFKDRRDLKQHTYIHSDERKHVCKVCNKGFNKACNLKVHERIHSEHKPFECTICHRRFIQKHVLTTHLKTHPSS